MLFTVQIDKHSGNITAAIFANTQYHDHENREETKLQNYHNEVEHANYVPRALINSKKIDSIEWNCIINDCSIVKESRSSDVCVCSAVNWWPYVRKTSDCVFGMIIVDNVIVQWQVLQRVRVHTRSELIRYIYVVLTSKKRGELTRPCLGNRWYTRTCV